jgi:hypothetical protein
MSDEHQALCIWGSWAKDRSRVKLSSGHSILYKISIESIRPKYCRPMHRKGIKAEMANMFRPPCPKQPFVYNPQVQEKDADMMSVMERIDKRVMSLDDKLKQTACAYYRDHPRAGWDFLVKHLGFSRGSIYNYLNEIKNEIKIELDHIR